jgi:purine-cytosine permease-like protein
MPLQGLDTVLTIGFVALLTILVCITGVTQIQIARRTLVPGLRVTVAICFAFLVVLTSTTG